MTQVLKLADNDVNNKWAAAWALTYHFCGGNPSWADWGVPTDPKIRRDFLALARELKRNDVSQNVYADARFHLRPEVEYPETRPPRTEEEAWIAYAVAWASSDRGSPDKPSLSDEGYTYFHNEKWGSFNVTNSGVKIRIFNPETGELAITASFLFSDRLVRINEAAPVPCVVVGPRGSRRTTRPVATGQQWRDLDGVLALFGFKKAA